MESGGRQMPSLRKGENEKDGRRYERRLMILSNEIGQVQALKTCTYFDFISPCFFISFFVFCFQNSFNFDFLSEKLAYIIFFA
jgi:hypothetical protein